MLKQLYSNIYYKVMEVSLNGGEEISQHEATSDAFIIVKEGTGKIIFSDNEIELQRGSTFVIPANKQHRLRVNDTFNACIIFASGGEIKFL
ncbi:MAG: cupin domain-containing protein [Ginsengibacter sp.]